MGGREDEVRRFMAGALPPYKFHGKLRSLMRIVYVLSVLQYCANLLQFSRLETIMNYNVFCHMT